MDIKQKLIELMREADSEHSNDESKTLFEAIAEKMIANRVSILTFHLGDIVYNRNAEPHKIISIEYFSRNRMHLNCILLGTTKRHSLTVGRHSLGRTVFLTREEAQQALESEGKI